MERAPRGAPATGSGQAGVRRLAPDLTQAPLTMCSGTSVPSTEPVTRAVPAPQVLSGRLGAVSGDQAQLPGPRGGLGPVGGAELAQDMGDVLLDRVNGDHKLLG